jgi:predicted DNA-binding transcriptional regulator AlpA
MNSRKHLRASECAAYLGIGRSTFWRWVKIGKIPPGVHLSPRCTVWPVEVLDAFVAKKAEEEAGKTKTKKEEK